MHFLCWGAINYYETHLLKIIICRLALLHHKKTVVLKEHEFYGDVKVCKASISWGK